MITFGGEYVFPTNDGVPSLNTVGVMMGRICRFNGGCREWYPVLAHSLAGAQCIDADAALAFLLHDAPEVCCADVPTPWKTEEAKARELMLLERMYKGWGLEWPIPEDIQAKVDAVDKAMVAAEAHVLGHPRASEFWSVPDEEYMWATEVMLSGVLSFITAEVAGSLFVTAFDRYRKVSGVRAAATA